MLYATMTGRLLTEEDLNLMQAYEVEAEGVYLINDFEEAA